MVLRPRLIDDFMKEREICFLRVWRFWVFLIFFLQAEVKFLEQFKPPFFGPLFFGIKFQPLKKQHEWSFILFYCIDSVPSFDVLLK